jgi:hypothetical protein
MAVVSLSPLAERAYVLAAGDPTPETLHQATWTTGDVADEVDLERRLAAGRLERRRSRLAYYAR